MPDLRKPEEQEDFGAPPSDEDFGAPPSDEDFGAPAAEASQEPEGPGAAASALRGVGQGLFMDFGEEIAGGLSGAAQAGLNLLPQGALDKIGVVKVSPGEAYRGVRDEARAEEAAMRKAHPVAFGVGKAAGALAPIVATAGSSAVQQGVGKVLGKVLAEETAKKVAPKVAAGLAGAAAGGVSAAGASTADNIPELLKESGTGAAIGGATGAFPLLAGVPAAGYALATGDEADRAELLASLITGGAASKLGGRRQARETGRAEASTGRAAAIKEVQDTVAPKVADIETQLKTSEATLAADEAQARKAVQEATAQEQGAEAGLAADERAVREQEAHRAASEAAKQFGSEEKAGQKAYTDYRKALLDAEAGGAKEQAALEKARANIIAEATKIQERRANLDAEERGKLGREYQSAYDALRNFLSVPDEVLDPDAIARRNQLQEKMGDVANRRFQDLTPEEQAKIYRAKLEADLAAEEGALNQRWMSLDEAAQKLPGKTEKGTPDLERFREPLVAEAKKQGLDVGEDESKFDLLATPPKAGERPKVPAAPLPAAQKLTRQKEMLAAIKAARESVGEGPLRKSEAEALDLKMSKKREAFKGEKETLGRKKAGLEESVSPENILAKGRAEIEAQKSTSKPEPMSLPTGKIDALRQVVGRLLGPRKAELKSPEARAAFHDAAYKRLNSQFAMAPANAAQDFIDAGRVLRAFAAGNIAPAHLIRFGEGNPVLMDALNSASTGEEDERNK